MEAEPLELEDGEVVDDEPNDIFEEYNVLQRPHSVSTLTEYVRRDCNDESDNSSDSETDSDSDSVYVKSKRPKPKLKGSKSSLKSSGTKHDKYKVWCTQVQEESLTEDMISCGVTKNPYQERSVESYNFTLRYSNNIEVRNNNSSEEEKESDRRPSNKRTYSDRYNAKLRLGKRSNTMDIDSQKGPMRIIADLSTTVQSTDADVAMDITAKLNEKKDILIKRIVDIIGKDKAIDFFQRTKKIEEDGGMLIMNGSRRRTAGGVYLWLVKNDEHIPQEKIREIFCDDRKDRTEKKKKHNPHTRRQKAQELIRCLENGSDKDLPALLTRAELSTRQIAEEARLRRGEGMDRMPIDSDRTVTNPPPSPVTDDPDHTEHSLPQRHVQCYAEDCFDIGVDIDNMEVF